jgi:hypothetical protein
MVPIINAENRVVKTSGALHRKEVGFYGYDVELKQHQSHELIREGQRNLKTLRKFFEFERIVR